MSYANKYSFTAAVAGAAIASRGSSDMGTFVVGTTVAGAAGTVTLEGAPDEAGPWYPVTLVDGTTAISSAVTTGVINRKTISGNHAYLRANCTVFTTGPLPAWIIMRDRHE